MPDVDVVQFSSKISELSKDCRNTLREAREQLIKCCKELNILTGKLGSISIILKEDFGPDSAIKKIIHTMVQAKSS